MKIFGQRVKELLKENDLKQGHFADQLNVGRTTLCEWLNGHNEPPMEMIVKIADFFDVTTDYLLGRTDY